MTSFSYRIQDALGLHARKAGLLVKLLQVYESDMMISCKGKHGDPKQLFTVMGLMAEKGDTITFSAEGPDEREATEAAERFFNENL